ncbi:DinB family protein [Angustibacter peucedani]
MTWTAPDVEAVARLGTGTERELLEYWLDQHRRTLRWKCAGLTAEQLKTASNPPSTLTLLGLVRHLADCERWWFSHHAAGLETTELYCTDEWPDGDFDLVADADAAADLETFVAECQASREALAAVSLDDEVRAPSGRIISVRWIYVHMIEEYARHNGHADFLREQLDGATGDFAPFLD